MTTRPAPIIRAQPVPGEVAVQSKLQPNRPNRDTGEAGPGSRQLPRQDPDNGAEH